MGLQRVWHYWVTFTFRVRVGIKDLIISPFSCLAWFFRRFSIACGHRTAASCSIVLRVSTLPPLSSKETKGSIYLDLGTRDHPARSSHLLPRNWSRTGRDHHKPWSPLLRNSISSPASSTLLPPQSVQFSSVAQSCLTLFTPWTAACQAPRPSPTPGVYSNSCLLSWWCLPTISSSVIPFSSGLQSFPASGSFPMSQFFASGGQSIGVSASASNLPMNIQDWFPLGWTGWISLQSKGLSRVFSNTTVQKHQFFGALLSLWSNSHIHTWLLEKP